MSSPFRIAIISITVMKKLNVLYICNDFESLEGGSLSLLYLVDSVKKWVNPVFLVSREGVVSRKIRDLGYECIIHRFAYMWHFQRLNFYHRIKIWIYDQLNLIGIWKDLKGRHIDIVHSNSSINVIGVNLAKLLKAKHVWHVREYFDLDFHVDVLCGLPELNRKLNTADARIAITQGIKVHRSLKEENTFVIWDAVRHSSDVTPILPKDKYFLFCSARLTINKGAVFAVECFAKSKLKDKGYRLKMIGKVVDGDTLQKIKDIAIRYKCVDSIDLLGYQTNVRPYFEKATAFMMCSIFEGLGRVTVESMFYGCPVIGRNTGGTAEIVKPGISGYLFDNEDECIELMRKVISEDSTALAESAQRYAVANFSTEHYGPEVMKVYWKVMS